MSKRLEVIKETLADPSWRAFPSIGPALWALAMSGTLNPIIGLRISELIDELEKLKKVYGDRPIVSTDANHGCRYDGVSTVTIDKPGVHLTLWLKDEEEASSKVKGVCYESAGL